MVLNLLPGSPGRAHLILLFQEWGESEAKQVSITGMGSGLMKKFRDKKKKFRADA